MLVKDLINLIDYPDDVTVQIYSYVEDDIVYVGLGEDIPYNILEEVVKGIEFPEKNCVLLNF